MRSEDTIGELLRYVDPSQHNSIVKISRWNERREENAYPDDYFRLMQTTTIVRLGTVGEMLGLDPDYLPLSDDIANSYYECPYKGFIPTYFLPNGEPVMELVIFEDENNEKG